MSSTSLLLQPIIPCRRMALKAATVAAAKLRGKILTKDNVFVNLRNMEFVVRGPLQVRAQEIEKELQKVRTYIHNLCVSSAPLLLRD